MVSKHRVPIHHQRDRRLDENASEGDHVASRRLRSREEYVEERCCGDAEEPIDNDSGRAPDDVSSLVVVHIRQEFRRLDFSKGSLSLE